MRNHSVSCILRNRLVTRFIYLMRRDVFQAIADPVRRDIMSMLAHETMNVNTIADRFDISRPAISKHIKILRECGLVDIQQKGRERHCVFQPDGLANVAEWVDQFRALWEAKLDSFEAYVNELQRKRNTPDAGPEND